MRIIEALLLINLKKRVMGQEQSTLSPRSRVAPPLPPRDNSSHGTSITLNSQASLGTISKKI